MTWDIVAIALTIIALLGSLAATMIALFYRAGTFRGSMETRLDHLVDEVGATRQENNNAHEQMSDKLTDHQDRIVILETQTRRFRPYERDDT